jgi:hypothetical protein
VVVPRAPWILLTLSTAVPARADVHVHRGLEQLDVQATAAPLTDVLEGIARETGMKVIYDGSPRRVLVSVRIRARTEREAVSALLYGLGLNYAWRTDTQRRRVETLYVLADRPEGAAQALQAAAAAAAAAAEHEVPVDPPPADFELPLPTETEGSEMVLPGGPTGLRFPSPGASRGPVVPPDENAPPAAKR